MKRTFSFSCVCVCRVAGSCTATRQYSLKIGPRMLWHMFFTIIDLKKRLMLLAFFPPWGVILALNGNVQKLKEKIKSNSNIGPGCVSLCIGRKSAMSFFVFKCAGQMGAFKYLFQQNYSKYCNFAVLLAVMESRPQNPRPRPRPHHPRPRPDHSRPRPPLPRPRPRRRPRPNIFLVKYFSTAKT